MLAVWSAMGWLFGGWGTPRGHCIGAVSLSMVHLLCRGYPLLFVVLWHYDSGLVVLADHTFTPLLSVCQVGGSFLHLVWLLVATILCLVYFLSLMVGLVDQFGVHT